MSPLRHQPRRPLHFTRSRQAPAGVLLGLRSSFTTRGCAALGVVLVTLAVTGPAWADGTPQEAMEEADRLEKEARVLSRADKKREAIALMERSISLQETRVIPPLPAPVQVLFRAELTESKLFLASLYEETDQGARAATMLEGEIAFHEQLPDSKHKGDLPKWRQIARELRASAPAPTPPPAPPPRDDLSTRVKTAIGLARAGRDSEALVLFEKNLPALEKEPRPDPLLLATANMVVADLYEEASQLGQAELHYLSALKVAEQLFGPTASELLPLLGKLGHHYLGRGDSARASTYIDRRLAIAEPLGHAPYADALMNSGALLLRTGDSAHADRQMRRALELYEREKGAQLEAAMTRFGIAQSLDDRARFKEAEALYEPLRLQLREVARKDPSFRPVYAALVGSIGWHYRLSGDTAQAVKDLTEAMALRRQSAADEAALVMTDECNLGEVYWVMGDMERALAHIKPCFDRRDVELSQVLAAGSEEQKRSYLASYLLAFTKTMTAQLRAGNGNPRLNALALTQVLRMKGRVLDAMAGSTSALRRGMTSESRELLDRLATVRTTMAKAASAGTDLQRLKSLEEEARSLEAKLAEVSAGFKQATAPVDVAAVQRALPAGHALVEFVAFAPLDANYQKREDARPPRYLAFVLGKDGEPQSVDLGVASEIDAAVASLRTALSSPASDPAPSARALHDKLMGPLEPLLRGATKVVLSPDGALNAVPFAALMDAKGKYLVDRYTFTYVTSGRDLLRFTSATGNAASIEVFADPKFDLGGSGPASAAGAPTVLATTNFSPLPGTAEEGKAVQALFPDAKVHLGEDASEAMVKSLSHPGVLHLATHGFFLGSRPIEVTDTRGFVMGAAAAKKVLLEEGNPMLRSGLVFAGATGLRGKDGEDGILTALEVAGLDLTGTRLVVLSACQTGEGEIRNGEGVYGLRRAMVMAGAESLVMSLWSVADVATGQLMRGYYQRLKAGRGRSDALRESQLEVATMKLEGKTPQTWSHPFFWAAFIPSGDPGGITLETAPTPAPIVAPPPVAPPPDTPATPAPAPSPDGVLSTANWPDLPFYGFNAGVSRAALGGRSAVTLLSSVELSLLSAIFDEEGNEGTGFVIYDRAIFSLGIIDLVGDSMGSVQLDYALLGGYRGDSIALLVGVRWGNALVGTVDDDTSNWGSYLPIAARLELNLDWFDGTRLAINGWAGKLAGERFVAGFDVRLPFTSFLWVQAGFQHLGGQPGHPDASLGNVTLGFAFDD